MDHTPRRTSGTRATLAATLGTALIASLLVGAAASPAAAVGPDVFINEIHYDNDGTDAGEFVEVAGPAGTVLDGWSIVLYNGNGGGTYATLPLSGSLPDSTGNGYGFAAVNGPSAGIQNGDPDGLALVDAEGDVVQFLSYDGVFTATDEPAQGMASTDIGVGESGSTQIGQSLQLTGTGSGYGDFSWSSPEDDTPGAANVGQTFLASGEPQPPITSCPPSLVVEEGTAASAVVSATDADSAFASIRITSAPVEGVTLEDVTVGDSASARLAVSSSAPAGRYDVVVEFATDDDPAQTASCTVAVSVLGTTPISQVQGSGSASPLDGEPVVVEAVVTSLFEDDDALDGFFVQEEDADVDGDPATSEGLFVFCRGACPAELAAGDLVRLTGTVDEFFGMTQLNVQDGTVEVLSRGNALPTATVVELPASGSTEAEETFEPVEGMVVTFPETLVVSEYFELARYGQLVLHAGDRPYQFTHLSAPSVEGYEDYQADLAASRIILDDDNNDQNDAIEGPDADEPYPYPEPGLSVDTYVRGGDSITGLTAVMHWSFAGQSGTDAWRLRPIATEDYVFERENPRPGVPDVGGDLTVASFNVLNFFTTIDETSSNSSGACAPSGTEDCRGADSTAELERQRAKIVAALTQMDADVVGLIEIQNDDGTATANLVEALNAATAPGTYAYVDTGTIGTDAIKQAFVYQPASVTPVGPYAVLDSSDDPRFRDQLNRPALVQTFEEVGTGERFTVAVNHFKSKGSDCDDEGDPNTGDGAGNCDETRTLAAQALADFLATDPTGSGDPDVLVIGDLNAYRMEDPITALESAGYTDLHERYEGDEAYGYVFDGQLGYLDHALANAALLPQVTGAASWHINADEVPLLDYNDAVRDAGEASFERESAALPLYEADPYRSSDHDPVLVGLDLRQFTEPVADAGGPYVVRVGRRVLLDASGSTDADGDRLTFRWELDGDRRFDDAIGPRTLFGPKPPGRYVVAVRVTDGENVSFDTAVVHVVRPGHGPQ